MGDLSKIVYLSAAQYETLKTNGTITVGGTTINYSNDDLYLTPDTTVPSGGSSGQFLVKASSTDYDTVWTGPEAGSSTLGLVKAGGNYGIQIGTGGELTAPRPTDQQIADRTETPRRLISVDKINSVVKAALSDTNHLTMTSAEQDTAASVLGFERIETVYDKDSASSSINWGYTSGFTNTTISGKDFTQYKKLIVYCSLESSNSNYNAYFTTVVDLQHQATSLSNRYYVGINSTVTPYGILNAGVETEFVACYAAVNSSKTQIEVVNATKKYNSGYFSNSTKIIKIEGVY